MWVGLGRSELVDQMACKLVGHCGAGARQEIVRVIEMLIDGGRFEMARLWTQVMHGTDRIMDNPTRPMHV